MKKTIYIFILFLPFCQMLSNDENNSKPELLFNFPPTTESASLTIAKAAAIDLDFAGNIFIVDQDHHQLLQFSPDGELLHQIGGFGQAEEQFDTPVDIVANTTLDIFVADYNNNRVVRYDKNLNFLNNLTSRWPEPNDFEQVVSIAVSSQYDLFLLEESSKKIIKFSRFSEPTAVFGGIYESFGQLLEPVQMCLDGSRRLFVSDPAQEAIVVFDYLGNFIMNLSHPDLLSPTGLFWGEDRRLYVVNDETADIYVFSQQLKFVGIISLAAFVEEIMDVAVKVEKNPPAKKLYALTKDACWAFRISPNP